MQHSNGYIITFSALVCVVCALFVSGSYVSLKPLQDRNILMDRQKNVLRVAQLLKPGEKIDADEIRERFDRFIRARIIDLGTGEFNTTLDPALFDQRAASKDPEHSRLAPPNPAKVVRLPHQALIYEVMRDGKLESVILPIQGYGLWSTLYGYIALAPDFNTVRGITYYEQGETAGLGGEVENPNWKAKWVGRKVFNERGQIKLHVRKGPAGPPETDPYEVDGLSGATLTSRGVTNMLHFWLGKNGFGPYFARLRAQANG